MEDFNRISYVVKNYSKLRGLFFFAVALLYSSQVINPFQLTGLYTEYFLPYVLLSFGIPMGLMVGFYLYYKKSVGVVGNYPIKLTARQNLLLAFILLFFVLAFVCSFVYSLWYFPLSLYFVALLLLFPNPKENWIYRRYIFWVAAVIVVVNFIPFEQFYSFKYDFSAMGLRNGISILLFYIPTGLFDHFQLLKLMRPLRAEAYKNSSASQDIVLGEPANLTILAALANCLNADFIFLRKISQLEETDFYRRLYGLEQAGLLYTFRNPAGLYKKTLVAAITPYGWQIVTRIYNETRVTAPLPIQVAAF